MLNKRLFLILSLIITTVKFYEGLRFFLRFVLFKHMSAPYFKFRAKVVDFEMCNSCDSYHHAY